MYPAHASPATHVTVAADPAKLPTLKPLISDILRTHFCIPGSILLVESVDATIHTSKRDRAVRLLLGDGDLCIQALVRRELHNLVDSQQVYIGSYVRLNSFELQWLHSKGGVNASKKSKATVLLVVREMTVVGWNTAFRDLAKFDEPRHIQQPEIRFIPSEIAAETRQDPRSRILTDFLEQPEVEDLSDIDDDDAFGTIIVAENQTNQHRLQSQGAQGSLQGAHPAIPSLPWISEDLTKPLKLTPLASIPNLPYKQNWTINVLAVIASLSDIEAATLPPFTQRTARLVDTSTRKQVLLTVFLDPETFVPQIGSVVLLLGVKNHRFDGGSLKKYGNEKPRKGSTWWIENPTELTWCDVAGLKKWWSAGG